MKLEKLPWPYGWLLTNPPRKFNVWTGEGMADIPVGTCIVTDGFLRVCGLTTLNERAWFSITRDSISPEARALALLIEIDLDSLV